MRAQGSSPRARGAPPASVGTYIGQGIIPACAGSTVSSLIRVPSSGDHPRVRGEHIGVDFDPDGLGGSSPCARGAREEAVLVEATAGIIPACAGSTRGVNQGVQLFMDHPRVRGEHGGGGVAWSMTRGSSPRARGAPAVQGHRAQERADHPRVRGEHDAIDGKTITGAGSSPRARGARRPLLLRQLPNGIIPACAGSTRAPSSVCPGRRDHPRVRGEHLYLGGGADVTPGSSPRARGARGAAPPRRPRRGIIPACAGSTRCSCRAPAWRRDHPRVRGEHKGVSARLLRKEGSSPRARGAPRGRTGGTRCARIIPACAGSTSAWARRAPTTGDHPRVRGEHNRPFATVATPLGSSPRARGAQPDHGGHRRRQGIIPACAGSTGRRGRAGPPVGDHPSVRGEHFGASREHGLEPGSSPRARGALAAHLLRVIHRGIIPACAGSTGPAKWCP